MFPLRCLFESRFIRKSPVILSLAWALNIAADAFLIDFGSPTKPSGGGSGVGMQYWNNVTTAVGTVSGSRISDLVDSEGNVTAFSLEILSRFNNANESGATSEVPYPATATLDSLFGNIESSGGLADVKPAFKLSGFDPGTVCTLTFYASRMGGSDNRETRYTVTGDVTEVADLDASNNVTNTASVGRIASDENGQIRVEMAPGPNNNNANHFIYLGVLQLDLEDGSRLLFDFGSGESTTATQEVGGPTFWNNLTTAVGTDNVGRLPSLLTTNGAVTAASLQMLARFNAANENGATSGTPFPPSASGDSLFGNIELFRGLAQVIPRFKLTGLDPDTLYTLEFYASRMGSNDNREARYTVQGAAENFTDLNAANNETHVATLSAIRPSGDGSIAITVSPGPNNNNSSHFTYLGVLRISWPAPSSAQPAILDQFVVTHDRVRIRLQGTPGGTYRLQDSGSLTNWSDLKTVTLLGPSLDLEFPRQDFLQFLRATSVP